MQWKFIQLILKQESEVKFDYFVVFTSSSTGCRKGSGKTSSSIRSLCYVRFDVSDYFDRILEVSDRPRVAQSEELATLHLACFCLCNRVQSPSEIAVSVCIWFGKTLHRTSNKRILSLWVWRQYLDGNRVMQTGEWIHNGNWNTDKQTLPESGLSYFTMRVWIVRDPPCHLLWILLTN